MEGIRSYGNRLIPSATDIKRLTLSEALHLFSSYGSYKRKENVSQISTLPQIRRNSITHRALNIWLNKVSSSKQVISGLKQRNFMELNWREPTIKRNKSDGAENIPIGLWGGETYLGTRNQYLMLLYLCAMIFISPCAEHLIWPRLYQHSVPHGDNYTRLWTAVSFCPLFALHLAISLIGEFWILREIRSVPSSQSSPASIVLRMHSSELHARFYSPLHFV
jgi:hypothetical protein